MNSQEAKRILEMYRPGGADASDPRFAEALKQLRHERKLAFWFNEQKAFDGVVASGVKAITVPADLKASLLANQRVVRFPLLQDWRVRAAVAAVVVILAAVAGTVFGNGPMQFADLRQQLIDQAWSADGHLDIESHDWNQVKTWLDRHSAVADFTLPPALAELSLHGGKMVEVNGRHIPFVCLADGPKHLHLFVMSDQNLRDLPPMGAPDFEKCGAWKTTSWQQGDKTFVLTGMNYQTFVSRFRKGGRWTMSG